MLRISIPMQTPGVDLDVVRPAPEHTAVVLVEPLYFGVGAALALDAGWGSVELTERADASPIPLVSFEQRPTERGGRCRVRGDITELADAFDAATRIVLLGSLVNARPLAARLALDPDVQRIEFVPVASGGRVSSDAWAVSGVLMRLLLEESERTCELDDAAGMAVSLGDISGDLSPVLAAGSRWKRHLSFGGSEDDLRVASAIDSVGIVPRIDSRSDTGIIVTSW